MKLYPKFLICSMILVAYLIYFIVFSYQGLFGNFESWVVACSVVVSSWLCNLAEKLLDELRSVMDLEPLGPKLCSPSLSFL